MAPVLACMLLVASALPARAGIRAERTAYAVFEVGGRPGAHRMIFVHALEMDGPLGYIGFGLVESVCRTRTAKGCRDVQAVVGDRRSGDSFEVAADLSSARLEITRHGDTHVVEWTAEDPGSAFSYDVPCGPLMPVGEAAGIARTASAKGTVFGRDVKTSRKPPFRVFVDATGYTC